MKYFLLFLALLLTACETTMPQKMVYLQRKFTHTKIFPIPNDQSHNQYVIVEPCGQVFYVEIESVENDKLSAVEITPCIKPAN